MKPAKDRILIRTGRLCAVGTVIFVVLAALSLFVGKYPLRLQGLLSGDAMQLRVFYTLRLSRVLLGAAGGFTLGAAGFVFQTVFRNPLSSPDIIGVTSGAGAGAAAGILFLSGAAAVTLCAFAGALAALALSIILSAIDRRGRHLSIVLAGIAVHALAQTALMTLKLIADPEKELASIEYWLMGSLNGVGGRSVAGAVILCAVCVALLFMLHRQVVLLSTEEGEARMLGVRVGRLRFIVLTVATLAVSAVVSRTGLISFIGLVAPHLARLLTRQNRPGTMLLSGLLGGCLLMGADILARCGATELPVSIFTSLLGAPFLIALIVGERRRA